MKPASSIHSRPNETAHSHGRLGGEYTFWWGLLLLTVGGLLGAGVVTLLSPAAEPAKLDVRRNVHPLPILGEISDFELIERSGDRVGKADLLGRVWVADFIFTSCAGICPIMTNAMARLQDRVRDNPEVTLVSISVDPDRDTPARLSKFANTYGADPVRWWFLTGDKRAIYRLSHESFRLSVEEIPEADREPDMEDVLHSSKFVLLDRKGRIRAYYDGEVPESIDVLAHDIERLLRE